MPDQFQSYDKQSGLVSTAGGRAFPASAIDPAQLGSIPTTSHVQTPDVQIGATPTAKRLLGGLQMVQQTIQRGMPTGTVDKVMSGANAAEDALATKTEGVAQSQYEQRTALNSQQREETQQREADSRAEEAMRRQRAEISRQNELALRAQEDPDVDPRRLIDSMSTGTKIVTVLLSALSGASAAVVGGGNGVMRQINKAIDDDIMAQREQIASGRIRRGNLVDYFQRQGLSEDAAADAARATSLANVERLSQIEAQQLDTEAARSQASLISQQVTAAREGRNAELKLKLEGQQGSSSTYARPQPAGGMSASDVLRETLAARDLASLQNTGQTAEEARDAPLKQAELENKTNARTESQEKARAGLASLDDFGAKAGLLQRNGKFLINPDDTNVLNARQREKYGSVGAVLGFGSVELESLADAAIESFGRVESGGAITGEEESRFKKMITSARTDAQLAERLNSIRTIVVNKVHARDRGTGGSHPYPDR